MAKSSTKIKKSRIVTSEITGRTFAHLYILEMWKSDCGHYKVKCRCGNCGSIKTMQWDGVRDGTSGHCGCLNHKRPKAIKNAKAASSVEDKLAEGLANRRRVFPPIGARIQRNIDGKKRDCIVVWRHPKGYFYNVVVTALGCGQWETSLHQ